MFLQIAFEILKEKKNKKEKNKNSLVGNCLDFFSVADEIGKEKPNLNVYVF